MPRPIVSEAAEELYISLGPWSRADEAMGESGGWPLLIFCEAIAGRLQPLESLIRDTDDGPGWSVVLDADRAPAEWLPWLGQFVGVTLRPSMSEEEQRTMIRTLPGTIRGTARAIESAAAQYLTGERRVYLIERHGSAYRLTVSMLDSEAPVADRPRIEMAIREQKPAGIVLAVQYIEGGDYNTLRDTHTSYDDLLTIYGSYDEILADPAQQ